MRQSPLNLTIFRTIPAPVSSIYSMAKSHFNQCFYYQDFQSIVTALKGRLPQMPLSLTVFRTMSYFFAPVSSIYSMAKSHPKRFYNQQFEMPVMPPLSRVVCDDHMEKDVKERR